MGDSRGIVQGAHLSFEFEKIPGVFLAFGGKGTVRFGFGKNKSNGVCL